MDENDEMVFVPAGVVCHECLGTISSEADKPVLFGCMNGGPDHIYHEECLPDELANMLMMKRTAAMN